MGPAPALLGWGGYRMRISGVCPLVHEGGHSIALDEASGSEGGKRRSKPGTYHESLSPMIDV